MLVEEQIWYFSAPPPADDVNEEEEEEEDFQVEREDREEDRVYDERVGQKIKALYENGGPNHQFDVPPVRRLTSSNLSNYWDVKLMGIPVVRRRSWSTSQ